MISCHCRPEGPRRRPLLDNPRFPAAAWPSSRPRSIETRRSPLPARRGMKAPAEASRAEGRLATGSHRHCRLRPARPIQQFWRPLDRDSPELADQVLKLALAADDSITTLSYVARTVPAARVDRFVDRRARIIPAQRVLPVRLPVASRQLARLVHEAVLLVNGRSSTPIQAGHNRFG